MKGGTASTARTLWVVALFLMPLTLHLFPHDETTVNLPTSQPAADAQGRAQTTWSGTQVLSGSYTVSVTDELIIQACTVVQLPSNERIIVEGRLTVLGTTSCPVMLQASGLGDHEGIQFNTNSSGRGSLVQNLTIEDSVYGITVYGSNPVIENLTVVNPDRVTLGAELQCSPTSLESQVLVGAEFNLTRSKVNVCVDGTGRVQSVLEAKLGMAPGSPSLSFAAEVDHGKDTMRFGYGLNIGG